MRVDPVPQALEDRDGVLDGGRDVGLHDRVAQVRRQADAQRWQRFAQASDVGPAGMRQAVGVELGGADHLIQEQRGVGHRLGEGAVYRRGAVLPLIIVLARDAAVRGLEPEAAGEAGRDADGAAAVARGDQRDDARGHGRR